MSRFEPGLSLRYTHMSTFEPPERNGLNPFDPRARFLCFYKYSQNTIILTSRPEYNFIPNIEPWLHGWDPAVRPLMKSK